MPTMRSQPKPRTIGIGESCSARKPAAVARQAVAMVGPPARGASRLRSAPPRVLVEARLELDRVVDGEPDQDRQHRDRGHRQRAADEAEQAEGDRRRRQRDRQRQQPPARAEDEEAGRAPSPRRRPRRGPAARPSARRQTPSIDDRRAGDDVAAAVELEAGRRLALFRAGLARRRFRDRGFDQLDRPAGARPRSGPASAGSRSGPSGVREEVGEPRLRRAARPRRGRRRRWRRILRCRCSGALVIP